MLNAGGCFFASSPKVCKEDASCRKQELTSGHDLDLATPADDAFGSGQFCHGTFLIASVSSGPPDGQASPRPTLDSTAHNKAPAPFAGHRTEARSLRYQSQHPQGKGRSQSCMREHVHAARMPLLEAESLLTSMFLGAFVVLQPVSLPCPSNKPRTPRMLKVGHRSCGRQPSFVLP